MTRRYANLKEFEKQGQLNISNTGRCPQCGKLNCCYRHRWVNSKWWLKTQPNIETMISIGRKY